MERIWTESYHEGVPDTIDYDAHPSLTHLIEHSLLKYDGKAAFENNGASLSFTELDTLSKQLANYLLHVLKLNKGDRVSVMLPNLLQYPVALFGILRAGLIVVNTNPLCSSDELAHQLNDSGTKALIILDIFASTLEKALPNVFKLKHIILSSVGDFFPFPKRQLVNFTLKYIKHKIPTCSLPKHVSLLTALKHGATFAFKRCELGFHDIAFLQYTGGTIESAKGTKLTHANLLANIAQARSWFRTEFVEGEEKIITALPLHHIFALTANCLTFFTLGATNLLITNPRDIPGFIKAIKRSKFTVITGVNTLYNALLNNQELKTVDFSHLKYSIAGGMTLQADVSNRWKGLTGNAIIEAYGLTETSPAVTMNPFYIKDYNGSVGLPLPSTNLKIIDESGSEVAVGETGELCVKGPQVMAGYWKQDEETAKVLTTDGWLKTGDIARIDGKGFVYLIDRKKDIIIVSGFNVHAHEVEQVINGHPEVLDVCVVPAADNDTGERVRACVIRKNLTLNQHQLISHCKEHLAAYKIPKEIIFFKELHKTKAGKASRRYLRG